jgi:hypothetical protein
VASLFDSALLAFPSGVKVRYGTTTTWASAYAGGGTPYWIGVAVDFDQGYIWFGGWNFATRTMVWGTDPATLTGPDMTFTAGTEMKIAAHASGSAPKQFVLVAENNNVVGLPSGFSTWNGGGVETSLTATPSGTVAASGARVLWPYGVMT